MPCQVGKIRTFYITPVISINVMIIHPFDGRSTHRPGCDHGFPIPWEGNLSLISLIFDVGSCRPSPVRLDSTLPQGCGTGRSEGLPQATRTDPRTHQAEGSAPVFLLDLIYELGPCKAPQRWGDDRGTRRTDSVRAATAGLHPLEPASTTPLVYAGFSLRAAARPSPLDGRFPFRGVTPMTGSHLGTERIVR
jgi:hypothetical protein